MPTLSENPQKSIEELVPEVVSALVRPMTSRELAATLDLSTVTIGNVLKLASHYGLTRKVPPFRKKAIIWDRTEGDTYTAAWSAWENCEQKLILHPSEPSAPSSHNLNTDFWSRWLRNDPSTRPKLDD